MVSNDMITTIAKRANDSDGYRCDGALATLAIFAYPTAVFGDSSGDLYVILSNTLYDRLREVMVSPIRVSVDTVALSFGTLSGGAPPPEQSFRVDGSVFGIRFDVIANLGAGPCGWLTLDTGYGTSYGVTTPLIVKVSADPTNLLAGTCTATASVIP